MTSRADKCVRKIEGLGRRLGVACSVCESTVLVIGWRRASTAHRPFITCQTRPRTKVVGKSMSSSSYLLYTTLTIKLEV